MSILNLIGISDAFAQTAPAAGQSSGSFMSLLPTLIIFILIFYFLLIRPQSKRAKDHRKLIEGLGKDDEVVTTGGLAGRIVEMDENFITLKISKDTEATFQKNAIAVVLPKGTLKSL